MSCNLSDIESLMKIWRCSQHFAKEYGKRMTPKRQTTDGHTSPVQACDEYLQECGLCHDLFVIKQVQLQTNGQILCAKCAAGWPLTTQPSRGCPVNE